MKLRTAALGTAAMLLIAALCAGAAIIVLSVSLQATADELTSSLRDVRTARAMQGALDDYRYLGLATSAVPGEEPGRVLLESRIHSALDGIDVRSPDEQEQINRVRETVRDYFLLANALDGKVPPYEAMLLTAVAHQASRQAIVELLDTQLADEVRVEQAVSARARTAMVLGMVLGTLLPLIVALTMVLNVRQVVRPLGHLREAMQDFMAGNVRRRARVAGPDEVRDAAVRFNDMADALVAQWRHRTVSMAGVAHDLRTPLSTLQVTTSMLARTDLTSNPERLQKHLGVVSRQVARLDRMISDLIDVSRIEAGELELNFERHDLVACVRSVAEMFEHASRLHRVEVEVPDEPVVVECDEVRVEQILVNLVSNGIKYSPAGGTVQLGVRSEDDVVWLWVSDEGVGITQEDRRHLFQPFRRLAFADSDIPGVGLGLSVVNKLVGLHRGKLEVESEPGEGASFRVRLPKQQPSELDRSLRLESAATAASREPEA